VSILLQKSHEFLGEEKGTGLVDFISSVTACKKILEEYIVSISLEDEITKLDLADRLLSIPEGKIKIMLE